MEQQQKTWTLEEKNRLIDRLGKVAVFFGGDSAEREVSLKSGGAVFDALKRQGVDVISVDAKRDVISKFDFSTIDRVFLALHGRGGEDGTIQGYLETLGVPYTGSGVQASSLAMDKVRTKRLWLGQQLPTPAFYTLNENTDWEDVYNELGPEICVKPAHEGSSIGVEKVTSVEQMRLAFEKAREMDSEVLAEKWVSGPEFTVAILDGAALPVIGLSTDNQFYDYDAKYLSNETQYLLPSGLSEEKESEIKKLAVTAFNSVGCNAWGRVDVMTDEKGEFWLLEVNTIPGMTDHSLVPMAANESGIVFDDLVLKIIATTI
jgi:D-alanine-D-alanine ligase